jgi:transposase-like protein
VKRSDQRRCDPALRAEALKLASEVGSAEAARRLAVPSATVRAWRHRAGHAGPPQGADPADWAARKQAGAEEAWAAAQEALSRCRELLEAGDARQAQSASVIFGVLVDKSEVLERAAQTAREREERLAETEAHLIIRVLRTYLESIGLSFGRPAASTLSAILRQAAAGEPLVAPPVAAEARAEVRRQVGSEPRQRALPGGDDGVSSFPRPM